LRLNRKEGEAVAPRRPLFFYACPLSDPRTRIIFLLSSLTSALFGRIPHRDGGDISDFRVALLPRTASATSLTTAAAPANLAN
jgi:hypothetical protein